MDESLVDVRGAQKLYILGHPVGHSKSPVMYNAVYEKLGLPWTYGFMDCETSSEADAFLARKDFLSVNITTPYKPNAYAAADMTASSAKLANGANVLVKRGGKLVGFNTDGQGCVAYLERKGCSFSGKRVVVCGTGPTALSIYHAAALAGADELALIGRNADRARDVLKGYAEQFGKLASVGSDLPAAQPGHRSFKEAYDQARLRYGCYEKSSKAFREADIVIDATSLGMKPNDPSPFDTSLLHDGQTAFDVVYGHGETAFVAGARDAGCTVYDGAGMLVAQAVVTVQIINDMTEMGCNLSFAALFDCMAEAAGFTC